MRPGPRDSRTDPGGATAGLAGRSLAHYRILEELGRGGMGRVYLAEDENLGRRVALKFLTGDIAGDAAVRRLEQEARLLGGLAHPNIAVVHSLEEADGLRFFSMELVPGRTLQDRISGEALPVPEALGIGQQIARALEAAHDRGVIHRDLKPANIRITPDDHVKVLDFGLARAVETGDSGASTVRDDTATTSGASGTPGYMSPEQLRGRSADARADLWAFGCVLFECLTGQAAFSGRTRADRIAATLTRTPDWSILPEDAGPRIRELLERCLSRDPEDRPRRAREVRREIEEEIARRRLAALTEPPGEAAAAHHNLPRRLDRFVGREAELREIERRIGEVPLLTLAGAGGCGKSRLALESSWDAVGRFPNGVWLVELAPLGDPSRVPQAVARVLGCQETPEQSLEEILARFLHDRKLLLVLDNCEHLLSAVADLVRRLIRDCPDLVVLASSREALGIPGETLLHVSSLALPGTRTSPEALKKVDSVELFVARARAGQAQFALTEENGAAVAQICNRLDGIPLALELAAARIRSLAVGEIARRLDDRFALLVDGSRTSLPKHRTLRALIDWSYELLATREQALLRNLAVFSGGWTLDAAEQVCAVDGMPDWEIVDLHSRHVDKSLVEMTAGGLEATGQSRYRMLETVRQYAWDLANPSSEVRAHHRDYFLRLAEEAEPELRGGEQARWLTRLGLEHENIRAAFLMALEDDRDSETALRLAGALGRYWMVRGHWTEGLELCHRALTGLPEQDASNARARTLNTAGNLAFHVGLYDEAGAHHREALGIRRAIGIRNDEAMSLNNLGEVERIQGRYASAREYYHQAASIQRDLGDHWGLAVSLNNLGETAQAEGDYEHAREYHEEACTLWPELGDRWGLAFSLSNLGFVATRRGNLSEARGCYQRSLDLARELGDRFKIALSLRQLGEVALAQRDWDGAAAFLRESLDIRHELGDREGMVDSLESFAALFSARHSPTPAARLLGASEAVRDRIHAPTSASRQDDLSRVAERIRTDLGATRYQAERDRGSELTLEDAVAVVTRLLDAAAGSPSAR